MEVTFVLKPMDNVFSVTACLLFVCGILANVRVLKRVYNALRREHQRHPPRHVFVYIGALVITDIMLLINIPFFVTDHATGEWMFGEGLCKFTYCNESINKCLTSFILAALSFDRLVTVRKILKPKWRTLKAATRILLCSLVAALILVYPLYIHTKTVDLYEENNSTNHRSVYKCVFEPPESQLQTTTIFTLVIFSCGFCLPLVFILGSYGTILYYLIKSGYFTVHGRSQGQQITWYLLLLSVIYLLCWTPYWVITVIMVELDLQSTEPIFVDDDGSPYMTYVILFVHLLPYLNAVLNPIAYGYLTRRRESPSDIEVSKNFSRNETWSPDMVPLNHIVSGVDVVNVSEDERII